MGRSGSMDQIHNPNGVLAGFLEGYKSHLVLVNEIGDVSLFARILANSFKLVFKRAMEW